MLLIAAAAAATVGAAGIPLRRLPAALGLAQGDPAAIARDQLVLWSIRLPRIALAIMIGALLAAGGTVMQGLFRNPLADPALVGVAPRRRASPPRSRSWSATACWQAAGPSPFELLPVAAFVGALIATVILYRLATRAGRTSIATLLLGGLAIGALANAGIGLLVFLADDRQLRDITFWMLGSLGGATWGKVLAIAPFLALMLGGLPFIARGLDLIVLGEAEAFHMGVAVERLKRIAHRAGRGGDRRGGVGRGRDRLRRHRGAASAAARDRSRPSAAAAGRGAASARSCCSSPTPSRASWRRRPNCRSAS